MFRGYLTKKFGQYVKQYFVSHPEVKLVVVTGSVGKSTAKRAIGTVLAQSQRVRMHDASMTTPLEVYLSILGVELPLKRGVWYYLKAMQAARYQIKHPATIDVVVQELAVDRPGLMQAYAQVLHPHIAVATGVTPEHMSAFGTLEAVAAEELAVTSFSEYVLINRDDVAGEFASLETNANFNTYGTSGAAEYRIEPTDIDRFTDLPVLLVAPELQDTVSLKVQLIGEHSLRSLAAAAGVAFHAGMALESITRGLEAVTPLNGRMSPLRGLGGTTVIDDTFSMDPASTIAAIQTLYQFEDAPQRIVVLGTMSDLGAIEQQAYTAVGNVCNPNLLAWVVTVGEAGARYIAPLARSHGCQVKMCTTAIEAGEFVRSVSEEGGIILVKGGIADLLEEAVKNLVEISEHHHLVRQDAVWLTKNSEVFSKFADEK